MQSEQQLFFTDNSCDRRGLIQVKLIRSGHACIHWYTTSVVKHL